MENIETTEFPSSSFEDWLSNNSQTTSAAIIIDLSSKSTIRCGKTNIMDDRPSHSFRRIKQLDDSSNTYSEEVKLNIAKALEVMNVHKEQSLDSILIIDSPLDHVEDLKKREEICQVMFKDFKVSHLSIQDAAYMSLVASGVEFMSGLIIHIGESSAYVVAVVDGQVRMDSICVGDLSGRHLTEKLKALLQKHFEGRFDTSIFTDDIVNRLKAKYVSAMFENFPLYESFNVTDTVTINIGECKEEFKQVSEMLFSESSQVSIPQLVKECIGKINDDSLDISNNIILSGGTTMMNDLVERLNKELTQYLDEITFNELANGCSDRRILRFLGANTITSVPEWVVPYCVSREDFEQDGSVCIVDKRSWDVMFSSPFSNDQFNL